MAPGEAFRVRCFLVVGYRINPLGAELRRGRRLLVGAIVPSFEDPLFGRLLTALERHAEVRGYAFAAISSRGSESREADLVNRMHDWRVAGVIVAPVKSEDGSAAVLLKDSGLPAVFIDRVMGGRTFDTVSADYKAALERISTETGRLKSGHTLLLHGERTTSGSNSHTARFKRAFASLNGNGKVELLNCAGPSKTVERDLGMILDRRNRPTTAIALWAPAALIMVKQAMLRGWDVPGDITIVGFEAPDWMHALNPAIASIKLPSENIAARAIELLFRRMDFPSEPTIAAFETCQVDFGRGR